MNCSRKIINTLSEFVERQRKLVSVCAADDVTADQIYAKLDEMDAAIKREIQVLVAGQFSSGKTTLINALLGEELLFTSILPSTAIPTELRYGMERRAIIYPRKSAWHGSDRPFEITPSPAELRKYCGWNQDDSGHRTESLFIKAEIFIPNPILEQGVTFVEVPATIPDSSYSHSQYKFDNYTHHADILLYVVNATRAFTYSDQVLLRELSEFIGPGLSVAFAVTSFDVVSSKEKQRFTDYIHKTALRYTANLGADAIHFVDSRSALMAKKTNDHAQLVASGVDQLEHYLLSELCHKMNCQKINDIIQQIEQANKNLSAQIEMQYNISAPDDSQISDAFQERSQELLGAQLQIELIRQELNNLRIRYK